MTTFKEGDTVRLKEYPEKVGKIKITTPCVDREGEYCCHVAFPGEELWRVLWPGEIEAVSCEGNIKLTTRFKKGERVKVVSGSNSIGEVGTVVMCPGDYPGDTPTKRYGAYMVRFGEKPEDWGYFAPDDLEEIEEETEEKPVTKNPKMLLIETIEGIKSEETIKKLTERIESELRREKDIYNTRIGASRIAEACADKCLFIVTGPLFPLIADHTEAETLGLAFYQDVRTLMQKHLDSEDKDRRFL